MATVYVGGASIDENGKAKGGKAGNQTGRELRKQKWYLHSKGWRVFRAKNLERARMIAEDMRFAIANKNIGYDQSQRNTLYIYASRVAFNCSKVTTKCETDCSALVRVCCAYAGIMDLPSNFRTGNMPDNLMKTGYFEEMKGSKYTKESAYLREGDILVTARAGHTVVVLNDGAKAGDNAPGAPNEEGDTVEVTLNMLKRGSIGNQVWSLQALLIAKGYDLGKYGLDGEFGGDTEKAVKDFQQRYSLDVDGIVGKDTWSKLLKG